MNSETKAWGSGIKIEDYSLFDQGSRSTPFDSQQNGTTDVNPKGGSTYARHGNVKLSAFWPTRPQLWFTLAECIFRQRGVSNNIDKFNIVVSHLNLEVIEQVEETLSQQNYFVLKEALIQRYTLSPDLRLQKIFTYEDLGDKTPSQVLKALRTLASPELLPEESLRLIWLRKLPANIRAVIAAETDLPLQVLAKKVDTIANTLTEVSACSEFNYSQDRGPRTCGVMESDVSEPGTCNNTSQQQCSSTEPTILQLAAQVAKLNVQLTSHHQQLRSRSWKRGRNAIQQDLTDQWCWYHRRFGNTAR
ncbi:uncharacterized protein LOC124584689 [Schistocerca americana]|uniref:uncharacterized protein LOC124584689 n=1 Tax=Schistocerca americana TaxID=7009 RepID=UPI001F4FB87D|nr:uncharacterized protein LOC124584689 [Schistocerca americana]